MFKFTRSFIILSSFILFLSNASAAAGPDTSTAGQTPPPVGEALSWDDCVKEAAKNHPDLISAVENRAKIKEQLDAQLRGYENALEMAYKEADSRVTELKRQLSQAKVDQILSARDRMRPFEEAAQKLEDETKLLTTLKLTLRQREIDFQVPKRTIEILNTAEPARRPSRPNWPLNITFALLFGLSSQPALYFQMVYRGSDCGLNCAGLIAFYSGLDTINQFRYFC